MLEETGWSDDLVDAKGNKIWNFSMEKPVFIKKLKEEKKELVKERNRVGLIKGLRANIKRRGGLVARNHKITPSIN